MSENTKELEWQPAPGYILAKPMTREELTNSSASLALPDDVSKEKDSVGVARIIECGLNRYESGDEGARQEWQGPELAAGALVAYIPFTDAILMEGFEKYCVLPYRNVMAIRAAPTEVK